MLQYFRVDIAIGSLNYPIITNDIRITGIANLFVNGYVAHDTHIIHNGMVTYIIIGSEWIVIHQGHVTRSEINRISDAGMRSSA